MFDNYEDFYSLFEQYPDAFKESETYEAFCLAVGKEYLTTYRWAPRVFATAKAGKRTYRPLVFPTISAFSELFEDARFLPASSDRKKGTIPQGYLWCSVLSMHIGGTRDWSPNWPKGETRRHMGATFYGTYVKPKTEVTNAVNAWGNHFGGHSTFSFEAIEREDGILVLAHDSSYIGSEWLALLPLTETIESLFDQETRDLLAREREAERMAWEK